MRINRIKLRIAMLRTGIETNRKLCEKSGVSLNTLSAITNGKTCVAATVQKLAAALGVDPADIIEED